MNVLKFLVPVIALFFTQLSFATSCPGINRGSHPYGLGYAAFNCYTDDYWLQDNFGGSQREQDFVRIRKNNSGDFQNSISLTKAGDKALVLLYFHNSGEEDMYPANNVKITLDWSNLANVKGTISASNTTPKSIDDKVSINLGANLKLKPLALYYKGTKIKDLNPNSTSKDITFTTFKSSYKNAKYFFVSFVALKEISKNPKISVAKVDINSLDQDGTDGSKSQKIEFDNANKTVFGSDDSQTIKKGEVSEFKIIVKNIGDVSLTDVVLTDSKASSCNRTAAQTRARYNGSTFDPGESFSYICKRLNIRANYVNEIMVSAKANGKLIGSADRSEVIIQTNSGFCGDGKVDEGEACDDGNNKNNDTCTNTCQFTICGDGIIQNPNGRGQIEECDDGSKNGQKGKCSTSCKIVGGGGGGGGAPVVSSIGTCAVAPGHAAGWQCQERKPYQNGEGWEDYRLCKEGNGGFDITGIFGLTRERKCVTAWAQYMNLDTCGNAGDSASNNAANCNPLPPVDREIIPNKICPGCFKASSFITKSANKEKIARGDEVEYNLKLTLGVADLIHYKVIDAKVRFYDFTIPAYGGNLWGRNGLSTGWNESPSGGKYFERYFGSGSNVIADMNTHGGAVIGLNYRMNSSLASDTDTASIDNVAFAVIDYTYRNIGCNTLDPGCGTVNNQKVFLAGQGQDTATALNIWKNQQQNASYSSLGDVARVEIIRPFVRASNGGNLGFEFSHTRTNKVTATDENTLGSFTTGEIFVDDNGTNSSLFDFNGYETIDNIDPLKQFQTDDINKYYDNLKLNAITVTDPDLGVDFKKPLTQEVYFLETGTLVLDGDIDLGGKNKTFIIESGNLVIGKNGVTLKNGFAAFIVRGANKSILIDKNTTRMEGLFIAEKGKIKSQNDEVSRKQLQVFGALMGNIEPLLNKRWFIGTNPEILLEPNIEIEFDLRLLENTPPTLERFLGDDWQEDVQ